ncbi:MULTISPECIES: cache domain-containing protein [unclassified Methylobacterium]|uniref:cache domain-containing protein n=1 Tax=unclassified Methylobacterium TaxID=2615210 RepID=UPI002269E9FF|nr:MULTISPECIES: cache domain-containing protein [unclassified Methylobacterium]
MAVRFTFTILLTALGLSMAGALKADPALACDGFNEAPISCDDAAPDRFAQWMLKRAATAVGVDEPKALGEFSRGEGGFRTADSYVFCVGPDGVMSAHPNPILRGHDVRDLHDKTGHYFIRDMLEQAEPSQVSVIRYLFPKPGSTVEEPKTTYYTRVADQVCAVGVYDADATQPASASTPEARVADLRRKLDGEIPAAARPDWTAFLEALTVRDDARTASLAKVRDGLRAVENALPAPDKRAAAD